MRNFIKVIIFLGILLFLPASYASASTISNVSAKLSKDKQVVISGEISSGAGQVIHIKIMDPNGSLEFAGTTMSTKAGSFRLTYAMKNERAGTYNVMLNAYGVTAPVSASFTYGDNNDLAALTISNHIFGEAFSPDTTQYSLEVDYKAASITVTPTTSDSNAKVKVNNVPVISGKASASIKLNEGENQIVVAVTALSGKIKTYTVTITKLSYLSAKLTADASIDKNKNVKVSGFISSGTGQAVWVIIKDPNGKLEYADTVNSSTGGKYEFSYKMTNTATGKYTVLLGSLRAVKNAAAEFYYVTEVKLKSLSVNGVTLSPAFSSNTTAYTASVDDSVDSVTLVPAGSAGTAKILVKKQEVENSGTSKPIKLLKGTNKIAIVLSASDASITKTYNITITKTTVIPVVTVKAVISKSKRVTISGNIGKKVSQLVSIVVTDPNGNPDYIDNVKSAADGTFQAIYKMTNTLKGAYKVSVGTLDLSTPTAVSFNYRPDTDLINLSADKASLTPAFSSEQINYNAAVAYDTSSIVITPTARDAASTIKVNGTEVENGKNSQNIGLNVGSNSIYIIVTSFEETKTYTINIARDEMPKSSNANLTKLSMSSGSLSPTFTSNTTSYTASVVNSINSITIMPTVSDNTATVTVNGVKVISGAASGSIALVVGSNTIRVNVTAQDNSTKEYIIIVTRAASTTCDVTTVIAPVGAKTNGTDITAAVANTTTSVTVNVTVSENADWKLYSDQACSTAKEISNKQMTLSVGGGNIAYIKVTAQNKTTSKVYTLTVTRAASAACDVTAVTTPAGAKTNGTNITAAVVNTTTSVTVSVTVSENADWKLYSDQACSTAKEIFNKQMTLSVGSGNIAYIKVTAQNKTTSKVYTLTVTRAASAACDVTAVTAPAGASISGTNITAAVANTTANITVSAAVSENADWKLYRDQACSTADEITDKQMTLSVGSGNIVYIKVTAQNKTTSKVYTLTVTRAAALSAACDVITVNSPTGVSISISGTSITAEVANATTSVTIGVAVSENADWKLYRDQACSSADEITDKQMMLSVGSGNVAYIKVTAQDGATFKVYTCTIIRAAAASTACDVITVNSPAGANLNDTNITAFVPITTTSVTVSAIVSDNATWDLYSDVICSTEVTGKEMLLDKYGDNIAYIKVTAQDGITYKIYTLNIKIILQ